MLFGNSEDVSGIAPTASQVQLTELMQKAWFAFANNPATGLDDFGWPQYDPEDETLVRLGHRNKAVPDFVRPQVYSWNCSNVVLAGGH
jgi:cholinesterase